MILTATCNDLCYTISAKTSVTMLKVKSCNEVRYIPPKTAI
jgi:hypothetical protein